MPQSNQGDQQPGQEQDHVIQYPTGHVVSFPGSMSQDELAAAAGKVWNHVKNAAGALSESLGGPSSIQQAKEWTAMLPDQLSHPVDTAKQLGKQIADMPKSYNEGQTALFYKAKAAWQAGDKKQAAIHFANYLMPVIGQLSDKSGEELGQGDYGKGIGHALGAVMPIVLDSLKGEGVPNTPTTITEAEAAKPTANPTQVVAKAPMSEVDRSAEAFMRRNRATLPSDSKVELVGGEQTPDEIGVNQQSIRVRGSAPTTPVPTEDEVNQFLQKQYGDSAPKVQIVSNEPSKTVTTSELNASANDAIKQLQGTKGYKPTVTLGKAKTVGDNIEHTILKDGEPVGILNARINGSGTAQVNWIGDSNMQPDGALSNKLGVSGVKDIKAAFADAHPEVKDIQGIRIGGARGNEVRNVRMAANAGKALAVVGGAAAVADVAEAKDKKPGKYDVKPLPDGKAPDYPIVTSDDSGVAKSLEPQQEQKVRDIINSFSIDKYPEGGIVFVPEKKYNDIRKQIEGGSLFGRPVAQSAQSTEHWGSQPGNIISSKLGDGFTVPQIKRTYINAAILNNDERLQSVLAHELGHHAAEAESHPDATEEAADRYKDAYLKRGKQTQQTWKGVKDLPVMSGRAYPAPVISGTSDSPLAGQ